MMRINLEAQASDFAVTTRRDGTTGLFIKQEGTSVAIELDQGGVDRLTELLCQLPQRCEDCVHVEACRHATEDTDPSLCGGRFKKEKSHE